MKLDLGITKFQKPLFTEEFYECDIRGGRARGGSHGMTIHSIFQMITLDYMRGVFVRATHGSIKASLWQDFIDRLDEIGDRNNIDFRSLFKLNHSSYTATYIPNGNKIFCKGFRASTKANTAHMKSLAGCTHVYIEELQEIGENEYNQLADSFRKVNVKINIVRSWNPPPKEHWVVRNYYDTVESEVKGYYKLVPKGIKGHLDIFGTYLDNYENVHPEIKSKYPRYKEDNPDYYYREVMGLISDGGDNKTFNGWKQIPLNEYLSLDYPSVYALDIGERSPCSLVEIKYNDGNFYIHEMLYKSKMEMKEEGISLVDCLNMIGIDKNKDLVVDGAAKSDINDLVIGDYNAFASNKKAGSVASGISFMNMANQYYTSTSENLYVEYSTNYLELDRYKIPIEGKPVKGNDHALDAVRYGEFWMKTKHSIVL